ncbi:hypothetical protein [Nitrosospira sp. NpAV]|nr:hypothetical protein [Nitrosospira sp. NpAV]
MKSHTWALARKYEGTVEANIKEAAAHRQMALEAVQPKHAAREE